MVALILIYCSGAGGLALQDDGATARVKAWLKVSLDHARAYRIVAEAEPDTLFEVVPQPVFRHSQPVRGDDIGAVYLWLDAQGLPAVIGTVFAYSASPEMRWVAHEMHSLSNQPLTARWEDETVWAPARPGVRWQAIPDAPDPAATAAQRLVQMRAIARRFQATSTDFDGGQWLLRLIPNPAHRYEPREDSDCLDGAVMLFCQGTDPEIILLIEARRPAASDAFQWQCAFASFTDYSLHVELDGARFWQADQYPHRGNRDPHWVSGQFRPAKVAEVEAGIDRDK